MPTAHESKAERLRPGSARILSPRDHPVGAAFVVDQRHLVTCAHVVNAALGRADGCVGEPDEPVVVEFLVALSDARREARTIGWLPIDAQGGGDVAVLEIAGDLPPGVRPLHLLPDDAVYDHAFAAIGFPQGHPAGIWATGRLLWAQGNDWVQLEDTKTPGARVERGFSGTAVWDISLNGVVGMVVAEDLADRTKTAFMIPNETIHRCLGTATSGDHDRRPHVVSFAAEDRSWAEWMAATLRLADFDVALAPIDQTPDQSSDTPTRTLVALSPSYAAAAAAHPNAWRALQAPDALLVRFRPCELGGTEQVVDITSLDATAAVRALVRAVGHDWQALAPLSAQNAPIFPPDMHAALATAGALQVRKSLVDLAATRRDDGGSKVVGLPVSIVEQFRDRVPLRAQLGELLASSATRIISVIGRRGIGKSAVAATVLDGLENDRWPHTNERIAVNGLVYISTRTGTKEISLERVFLDCAKLLPAEQQAELRKLWTEPKRKVGDKITSLLDALGDGLFVILLDNIEDVLADDGQLLDADLETFFDMAARARNGPRLLLTSRRPLVLRPELRGRERRIEMQHGLPEDDAIAFLADLDPDGDVLQNTTSDDLRRAVRMVHGVPHALQLIACRLADDPLLELEELINSTADRADFLDELVADSYARLDDDGRRVVDAVAVYGRPVSLEAVDWLLHTIAPGLDVRAIVSRLVRMHIVMYDRATKRISLHPMDADFAYDSLPATGLYSRAELHRRAADWHSQTRLPESDWFTLDDLNPQLAEFEHRKRAGDIDDATRVLCRINDFLIINGWVSRARNMHDAVAGRVCDRTLQMRQMYGHGLVYRAGGPLEQAVPLLGQALALAEELRERADEASILSALGDTYRFAGRVDDAVPLLQRAVPLLHAAGDVREEGMALMRLGLCQLYLGDVEQALATAARLEQLADDTSNEQARGHCFDVVSLAHLVGGRFDTAIQYAEWAIERYEPAGYPTDVPYLHNVIGMAHLAKGDGDQAITVLEQGRIASEAVDNPRAGGLCLYNLAWAYWRSDCPGQACDAADKATAVFERYEAPETPAARALSVALHAAVNEQRRVAATQLLAAASASASNPDLFRPSDLVAQAEEFARSVDKERGQGGPTMSHSH